MSLFEFRVKEACEGFPVECPIEVRELEGSQCISVYNDGWFSENRIEYLFFPEQDIFIKSWDSLRQGAGISYEVIDLEEFFNLGSRIFKTHKFNHPMRWLEGLKALLEVRKN